jgi:hypothetical protein
MLLFHDKPLAPDMQTLLEAVALLDISEFRLFELAYQKWYGQTARQALLEAAFVRYMFDEVIPCWVRHYARAVVNGHAGYPAQAPPDPVTRAGIQRGLRVVLGLAFLLVFLIVLASHSPDWMRFGAQCYFPPCY